MSIEDDIKQIKKDIKEIKQRLLMEGNVPDTKNVFLNNEELAKRWGIRASSLYQTRRKGFTDSKYKDLKYIKLGNKVAYRLSDVIAFEDTREFKLGVSTFENEEKDINEIVQRTHMEDNITDTENTLLTTQELAKRWNMSARTLENSRHKGSASSKYKNLKYIKFGNKVSYKLSDVIAFENSTISVLVNPREFKLGSVSVGNEEDDS